MNNKANTPTTIQHWQVDNANIKFTVKNAGINVPGTFQGFEGNITFDPHNLKESQLQGSISTKTIDTANGIRDFHLRMSDYFRVAKFPVIEMYSTHIISQGQDFLGTFDLTIKGKSKSIKIPFSVDIQDQQATFKARFEINRLDFGIGGRSFILNNTVRVKLEILASLK